MKFFTDFTNPFQESSKAEKDIEQKIFIIGIQVEYEFREELKKANIFKKLLVKYKLRKETKRRIKEKYGIHDVIR